jgi:transposase
VATSAPGTGLIDRNPPDGTPVALGVSLINVIIKTRYVTNVLDAENSRLLLTVEGRGVQALGVFAEALRRHRGDPFQIDAIAMDKSTSYMNGASQYFPQARIVFDKFHVMVLAGQSTR